jgi:hypothetical protein
MVIDGLGTVGNTPAIQFKSAGVAKGYVGFTGSFLGTAATDMFIGTDAVGAVVKIFPGDAGVATATFSTTTATFSGAVTVGGALKLGNGYVGTVIVPTGYVTIQDSNGNTYKIAVSA